MFKLIFALSFLVATPLLVNGHGMVMDPVNRASRWRFDATATPDYTDNGLYCGTFQQQWNLNSGKCGMCGDNYADPTPRTHELGNTLYGQGVIVKSYKQGSNIPIQITITANHGGFFQFKICNIDKFTVESDECFDDISVNMADGSDRHAMGAHLGTHDVVLSLPDGLVCDHCILQWTWVVANRWGICGNGTSAPGCGPQEHFRTCSDIAIIP